MANRAPLVLALFLAWAARDALAYRVEFIARREGQRLAGSEVCFYRGAGSESPAALYFASNDVRCLPADDVIDMPTGVWAFYARHRDGYVSFHGSALVRGTDPRPDQGYQSIQIDLRPAAYVDFAHPPADQFAAYVPMTGDPARFPATFPLPAGQTRLTVPADEPFVLFRVERGRPVAAGPMRTLARGEVIDAAKLLPPRDQRDVIAWVRIDDPSLEELRDVRAPSFTLLGADATRHPPLFEIKRAAAVHRSLIVVPNAPAGRSSIIAEGAEWKTARLPLALDDPAGSFIDSPITVRLAQRLTVTWALPSVPARRREDVSCHAGETSRPHDSWSVELCCRTRRTVRVDPEVAGSVVFDLRTPGEYSVVLNGHTAKLARSVVFVERAKDTSVDLGADLPALFGQIFDGEQPVKAQVHFETGSTVTDDAGRYRAVLESDPLNNVIEIVPCDGSTPFQHIPKEPIRGTRQYDIHIPRNEIAVSVVDAVTRRPIPRAKIGRGVFSTAEEARDARTQGDLVADEQGKAVLRRFQPGQFLRLCATADGYGSGACADPVPLEANTVTGLEIALPRRNMRRGRIVLPTPMVAGIVFRGTSSGAVVEKVPLGEDGTFEFEADRAADSLVVVVASQPLFVVPQPRIDDQRELVVTPPPGPVRTFTVDLASTMSVRSAWFTIAVGGLVIPPDALAAHLTRRGLSGFVEAGTPARVVDVVENAPLRVLATVTTIPPSVAIGNLLTSPEYAAIREFRDVPPTGRVIFDRR